MTQEQATKEATEIAKRDGIDMVVTFNQYDEALYDWDKFGYFPSGATTIFKYEKVVSRINPQGMVETTEE
jgi:hypothetical protein